ncbi:Uncharacterized protein PECH_008558 [Penicillium ucsense]|nr:Uncharacterized protein PECH_008558 [Penicillium ucsense]
MPSDRDSEDKNRDDNPNPSNTSRDPPPETETETNPFVAFRRFADEQVSAVLQSITGLPSTFSPPQTDRWTIFTDDETYESTKYRHRDSDSASASKTDEQSHASSSGADTTTSSVMGSDDSRPSVPEWRVDPFDLSPYDSSFPRLLLSALGLPSFPFLDSMEEWDNQWPLNFILYSSYSPTHLEQQARSGANTGAGVFSSRTLTDRNPNEPQWREAFEDLIRLENGIPMLDRNRIIDGRAENSDEWLLGMLHRGSMGPRFSRLTLEERPGGSFYQDHPKPREPVMELGSEDELAMYEQFLEDLDVQRRQLPAAFQQSQILANVMRIKGPREDQAPNPRDSNKMELQENAKGGNGNHGSEQSGDFSQGSPSDSTRIVSTTSQTEKTRYSDGTVSSRRIVTKNYADGREETDTFVETDLSHVNEDWKHGIADNSRRNESEPKPKSKGGWFWND